MLARDESRAFGAIEHPGRNDGCSFIDEKKRSLPVAAVYACSQDRRDKPQNDSARSHCLRFCIALGIHARTNRSEGILQRLARSFQTVVHQSNE